MDYKMDDGKTYQIDAETLVEAFDCWREAMLDAWNRGDLKDLGQMLSTGPILINPRQFAGTLRRDPAMRESFGITTAQIDEIEILRPEKPDRTDRIKKG